MLTSSFLLFLLLQPLLDQDQWRLVSKDGEVAAAWGEPLLSVDQRSRLQFAWVWSESRAPRRLEGEAVGRTQPRAAAAPARLEIRVALPAQPSRPPAGALHPAAPAADAARLSVVAAPLEMWRDLPEDALPTWRVPPSGRLSVPFDRGRRWRVRLRGEGQGSWWVDVPAGRASVLLAPAAAAGIEVNLSGPDGAPPANVRCALLEAAARSGGPRLWATLRAEAGRLSLPGLPDSEEVTLMVTASGLAPAALRGRPSELPRRLRLGTGATVSGRVTTAAGTPLAGAEARIEAWMSPSLPQQFSLFVPTKADGGWRLPGLPPGRAALRISAPGFVAVRELVDLVAGGNDLGIRALNRARTVAVLTVEEQGSPVAGAKVDAGAGTMAVSDGQGRALLGGLPEAPLALNAKARGHLAGTARYDPPFVEPLRVRLPRAFTLRGRLLEAPGVPVGDGSFRIEQPTCYSEDRLEDGGRFEKELTPGQTAVLVLRSPATRELRMSLAAGHPGEDRDLGDLLAPAGLALTGRVLDGGDGQPVAGARVWLPRPGPDGPALAWASRDLLQTTSDEQGRFRLSGLSPGAAVLRVEAAGFARAHREVSLAAPAAEGGGGGGGDSAAAAPSDIGDISLAVGATLRVVVKSTGAAVASEGNAPAIARADLRNAWLEPDMLTAPVQDGVAILRNIPSGTVTVSVLAGRKLLCEQQLVVIDREEREVNCGRAGLTVAGLVRVGGRQSGAGTLIWIAPTAGATSRIDTLTTPDGLSQQQVFGAGRPQVDVQVADDGSFSTDELTPGLWQVSWGPMLGAAHTGSQSVEIPAVERFDTVISYPGLALSGIVTYEDGRPAVRAQVNDLVSGAVAFSGADGSFAMAGLKTGKVALQARLQELTSKVVEAVLEGERPPEPVALVLGKRSPASIEIQVLGADGAPLPGVFVFLEEEGKGQRILTTDAGGKARAGIEAPLPPRVRPAATTGSAWTLGGWASSEQAQEGLSLQFGATGTLLVSSAGKGGPPQIVSADGWDLSFLLRQLGSALVLTPERPLRLDGLPPGGYTVSLPGVSRTVMVTVDQPVEVRLE